MTLYGRRRVLPRHACPGQLVRQPKRQYRGIATRKDRLAIVRRAAAALTAVIAPLDPTTA